MKSECFFGLGFDRRQYVILAGMWPQPRRLGLGLGLRFGLAMSAFSLECFLLLSYVYCVLL